MEPEANLSAASYNSGLKSKSEPEQPAPSSDPTSALPGIQPPELIPLTDPEKLDLAVLNSRLREYQILQAKRPMTTTECREGIKLIQLIRGSQSTSGPKAPKAKKPAKAMSLADFEASLDALEKSVDSG